MDDGGAIVYRLLHLQLGPPVYYGVLLAGEFKTRWASPTKYCYGTGWPGLLIYRRRVLRGLPLLDWSDLCESLLRMSRDSFCQIQRESGKSGCAPTNSRCTNTGIDKRSFLYIVCRNSSFCHISFSQSKKRIQRGTSNIGGQRLQTHHRDPGHSLCPEAQTRLLPLLWRHMVTDRTFAP